MSNSKNQAISAAKVDLYNFENQIVKSTITQNGSFEFLNISPQSYYLQITNGKSVQKEKPFQLSEDKTFLLVFKESTVDIAEVQLEGKKAPFHVQKGNITIDIANSELRKVATPLDLLAKLPFVVIDANGEGLSLVGKGIPLLYIDNQKINFTTLTSLSVDDIKSVEIIKNPSAKYEAEGNAVIKIILKNSKKEGSKLNIAETATFKKRFENYFSSNYQQKKNKTEWKINAAYNQIEHWESNGFIYSVPSKNINSDYIIKSITNRPQTILGTNLYQELNDDGDYITLNINGNFRPDKGDNKTVTNYEENGNKSNILTLNHQDRKRATINSIFNYNKKIKSLDADVFTGFQYTRESNKVDYNFFNNLNNTDFVFNQFRNQNYSVNAYSGRLDVEKKFKNDYELDFGGSFTKAEATTNNLTNYNSAQSSDYFKYFFKEENWASYAEFSGEKEKLSFKAGLRLESTFANGFDQILNQTTIQRNYLDWFPKAEISFKQNKDYVYTLNFSRNIERPNYGDLSSGGLYSSPYIEYQGNPNLLPTYTNTISASVNLKKWALNASYYESRDPMGYNLVYVEDKNISKFTSLNFDKEIGGNLGFDVPFKYKFLTSQNSLSLNYSKIEDRLSIAKKSTPYLYFYTNNTLKLGKGFNFLVDGSWITNRTQGIYQYNEMVILNLGLTKSISNFDFTLRYNDVFKESNFIQSLSYGQTNTKGTFYGNTPVFSIGIKYNFGKVSDSSYKEKQVNETLDRI
ncbi:TonB-dependent receptor domain-containing protein [Halpernia sp. GG3]